MPSIVKRGDKLYAYEATSEMVDGKKKTVSRYLGRVEPKTNELMEKIPEKSKVHREKSQSNAASRSWRTSE